MFTEKQLDGILAPIDLKNDKRIKSQDGHRYMPAHEVIDTANALFGVGMWDHTITDLHLVFEGTRPGKVDATTGKQKTNCVIIYLAKVRVDVRDVLGQKTTHEDVSTGEAFQSDSLPPPHDMAVKSAVSTAMKRAFRHFGNQFGNSLYDKDDASGQGASRLDSQFAAANDGGPIAAALPPASQPPAAAPPPAPASPPPARVPTSDPHPEGGPTILVRQPDGGYAPPAPAAAAGQPPTPTMGQELTRDAVAEIARKIGEVKAKSGGQHPPWVMEWFPAGGPKKSYIAEIVAKEPQEAAAFERKLDAALRA